MLRIATKGIRAAHNGLSRTAGGEITQRFNERVKRDCEGSHTGLSCRAEHDQTCLTADTVVRDSMTRGVDDA